MRFARPLLAGAVVVAGAFLATPAQAACFGTQQLAYVCVTAPTVEQRHFEQCLYAGGDTCDTVVVPYYGLSGDAEVTCGGNLKACETVNQLDDLFRPCGPLIACP